MAVRLIYHALVLATLLPPATFAIDFETLPDIGPSVDRMQINTQYWASDGVRFEVEGGGFPTLARRGGTRSAFNGPTGNDGPAASAPVGEFFLTGPTPLNLPGPLRIVFAGPVQTVSGTILDVDAGEVWSVQAWGGGAMLDSTSISAGDPGTGDGIATSWSFARVSADIDYVRFELTTGNSGNLGFAVDNITFAPLTTPTVSPDAGPINFESIPIIGAPVDRLEISNQFFASRGILFRLADGTFPEIAVVGGSRTAFAGPPNNGSNDVPEQSEDQGVGTYFLTDDGTLSGLTPPALIVEYTPATDEASGVVLDVDFDEEFVIEALNAAGVVVQTVMITAGEPNTGDGIATPWAIRVDEPVIRTIRFQGSRTAAGGFGLGFDNFDARSAPPLPSTIVPVPLATLGALVVVLVWLGSRGARAACRR